MTYIPGPKGLAFQPVDNSKVRRAMVKVLCLIPFDESFTISQATKLYFDGAFNATPDQSGHIEQSS